MGFYSQVILPPLLDWSLSDAKIAKLRSELLQDVQGEVLEIGFGTGLNLAYYPNHIQKITTVDKNAGMNAFAKRRIQNSQIKVEQLTLSSEQLPIANHTFDSVVSTFTLCSITNVQQALKEIHRVLKPGGRFFFLEHGLSDKPQVQIWQNRLTPLQKIIGDGCHLNRDIYALVAAQFPNIKIQQFTPVNMSEIIAYIYQGVATKSFQ